MTARGTTVFVVDDDPSVLRGLSRLLRTAGYQVEAYALPRAFLERVPVDRPGCVLVDLRMPDVDGLELQEELARRGCHLPLVFLTGHGDVASSVQAMKAGAIDVLTKPCHAKDILAAVESALARDVKARAAREEQRWLKARFEALTPREREVCLRVVQGRLNKEIAVELGATEKTIKVHRSRAMEKLGVETLVDLVRLVDRAQGP